MGPKAGTLVIILLGLTLLSDARSFLHSSLDSGTNTKTKISGEDTIYLIDAIESSTLEFRFNEIVWLR